MTPIDAFLILAAVAALSWGWFYAGRRSMVKRVREAATLFPPVIIRSEPSAELAAAYRVIETQRLRIETLQSMRLVPPSEYTVLPYQVVPSRREVAFSEGLVEELREARRHNRELTLDVAYFAALKDRHWASLKRLRARVKGWVPGEVAEYEADLRARSLSVARAASTRAAERAAEVEELATAITEIEVAAAEAQTMDQFEAELHGILERHQIEGIAA